MFFPQNIESKCEHLSSCSSFLVICCSVQENSFPFPEQNFFWTNRSGQSDSNAFLYFGGGFFSFPTSNPTDFPPAVGGFWEDPATHLDLLDGVDDEGVLQVLHGALHPVVEGGGSLSELQVKLVDGFQQLLRSLWSRRRAEADAASAEAPPSPAPPPHLQSLAAFLRQRPQSVPLVADPLAARVHAGGVVVVQLTAAQSHRV